MSIKSSNLPDGVEDITSVEALGVGGLEKVTFRLLSI